jgi:hypothetical protein
VICAACSVRATFNPSARAGDALAICCAQYLPV